MILLKTINELKLMKKDLSGLVDTDSPLTVSFETINVSFDQNDNSIEKPKSDNPFLN